jgi:hypothetical protein
MGCPGVLDINGQPLQLKLLPSVLSGGAAEFRNISEKHNFHGSVSLRKVICWLVLVRMSSMVAPMK